MEHLYCIIFFMFCNCFLKFSEKIFLLFTFYIHKKTKKEDDCKLFSTLLFISGFFCLFGLFTDHSQLLSVILLGRCIGGVL